MKRRIVYGTMVYESMAACIEDLAISYSVLSTLLRDAAAGRKALILGQPIYELADAMHHVERPETITAQCSVRRSLSPLITTPCRHRLGVYHGGSV